MAIGSELPMSLGAVLQMLPIGVVVWIWMKGIIKYPAKSLAPGSYKFPERNGAWGKEDPG